jgi:hypothetical protein
LETKSNELIKETADFKKLKKHNEREISKLKDKIEIFKNEIN